MMGRLLPAGVGGRGRGRGLGRGVAGAGEGAGGSRGTRLGRFARMNRTVM